jgi:hypothetical protein
MPMCAFPEFLVQAVEFALAGELPFPEQVGHLFERRVAGQVLDVVPGVNQLALLSVDEREGRIQRDHALQAACFNDCRGSVRFFVGHRDIQS